MSPKTVDPLIYSVYIIYYIYIINFYIPTFSTQLVESPLTYESFRYTNQVRKLSTDVMNESICLPKALNLG